MESIYKYSLYCSGLNSHIFVSEDDMWAAKGRFSEAIQDDDPILWDASADGKFSLSLLADGVQMAEVPGLSMIVAGTTPVIASTSASVIIPGVLGSGSGPAKSAIQELIITTLGIPAHLTDRSSKAKVDIRVAYAKYIALLDACKAMTKLVTSGTWTHKAVNNDDMIEIFMSKSAYFKNHAKVFCLVKRSPMMQKWLENADDAPADYEVWGYSRHTFDTLKEILTVLPDPVTPTEGGDRKKGKGKEKARDISSSPDFLLSPALKKKKKGKQADKKGRKGEASKKASTSKAHYV